MSRLDVAWRDGATLGDLRVPSTDTNPRPLLLDGMLHLRGPALDIAVRG